MKGKRGFTLVEMVLTMAIMLILLSAVTVGISQYTQRANSASEVVSSQNNRYSVAGSGVRDYLTTAATEAYTGTTTYASPTSHATAAPTTEATTAPASIETDPPMAPLPSTIPTTAAPTTQPTTPSPTPAPSNTTSSTKPKQLPGTSSSVSYIDWDGKNTHIAYSIPSSNLMRYITLYVGDLANDVTVFYGCTVVAFDAETQTAVVSVGAWSNGFGVHILNGEMNTFDSSYETYVTAISTTNPL